MKVKHLRAKKRSPHIRKIFLVMGGCIGDEHVIAVYMSAKKAMKRRDAENMQCPALEAYIEPWEVK